MRAARRGTRPPPGRLVLLSAVFLAGVWAAVPAAAFSVRSEVDATRIGVEDQLQLTITIEGSDGPAVSLPPVENLRVAGGPFQSTQVSIVNGRMSQSRTWTWVLQPEAVGAARVGAVTAGDESAPAISIEVVAGSVRPSAPARRADPFATDPFGRDVFEDFFGRRRGRAAEPKVVIEAAPSRRELRVGEPLLLTYFLYTQVPVSDLQFTEAPQYAGFWVEELERPKAPPSGENATLGGERYRRFPVLRKLLFPTRAGTLTIPPSTMRIGIPAQGFFDDGGMVERQTKPVVVEVKPLPDEPGFSGAVGKFKTTATLDRSSVPLGEAALLRFRVEGTGNLKWIDRAPSPDVEGARVYPPQVKSDLETTPEGVRGSRTWEFVVVPETSGPLEIPPVPFSYFDPGAGRIVTARTEPLSLVVEGGTGAAGIPAPRSTAGSDGGVSLPLRADLDPEDRSIPVLGGRAVPAVAGLVLLGHVALWGAGRVRGFARRSGGRAAPTRSVRAALRDLERAERGGVSKEQAAVLIDRALHEAFGEVADDDDSDRARAVRGLLSDVHFVRYAPQLGDYSENLRSLVTRARGVVKRWA